MAFRQDHLTGALFVLMLQTVLALRYSTLLHVEKSFVDGNEVGVYAMQKE